MTTDSENKLQAAISALGAVEVAPCFCGNWPRCHKDCNEPKVFARKHDCQKVWQSGTFERGELDSWQWRGFTHLPAWWTPERRFAVLCTCGDSCVYNHCAERILNRATDNADFRKGFARHSKLYATQVVTADLDTGEEVPCA